MSAPLLLEQSLNGETIWRPVNRTIHPLLALPVERVDPNPKHRRHWYFAMRKKRDVPDLGTIEAYIYKPDYVLEKFKKVVAPIFRDAYGFRARRRDYEALAIQLIQDTITYLLFHEEYHQSECPRSRKDEQMFDAALKAGIKRAEPHISSRDLINKIGNVRNAMMDYLIDTTFTYATLNPRSRHAQLLRQEIVAQNQSLRGYRLEYLPDGIVTTWDIVELAQSRKWEGDNLFYPVTRFMYGLLNCRDDELRKKVGTYFRKKLSGILTDKIRERELEEAVVGAFKGTIAYLDQADLQRAGVDRARFEDAAETLFYDFKRPVANAANKIVVDGITAVGTDLHLRYRSLEGIIEPLAHLISITKEEGRDGFDISDEPGDQDEGTEPNQAGGGAEQALTNLVELGDPEANQMLSDIANDGSAPRSGRNVRIENLSVHLYYMANASEIPVRSPTLKGEEEIVGKQIVYVLQSSTRMSPQEFSRLDHKAIAAFQRKSGKQCRFRLGRGRQAGGKPFRYDHYIEQEIDIKRPRHVNTGIILPQNVIYIVDSSGSMGGSGNSYVGTQCRYDGLQHLVCGSTKSLVKAAKSVGKERDIQVIVDNYSSQTIVSEAVPLVVFHETPNNNAKIVLYNAQGGGTSHRAEAFQEIQGKCQPGKSIYLMICDGDLAVEDQEPNLRAIERILSQPDNVFAYFSIFGEGTFARTIKALMPEHPNLVYRFFPDFHDIQEATTGLLVQYSRR